MTETIPEDEFTNRIPLRVRTIHGETVPRFPDECEPHTRAPKGYLQWHEWAEQMRETHVQRQCSGCGLWAIWELREKVTP